LLDDNFLDAFFNTAHAISSSTNFSFEMNAGRLFYWKVAGESTTLPVKKHPCAR